MKSRFLPLWCVAVFATAAAFIRHGVIVRPFGDGWIRVSVGTPDENDRFLAALDAERAGLTVG